MDNSGIFKKFATYHRLMWLGSLGSSSGLLIINGYFYAAHLYPSLDESPLRAVALVAGFACLGAGLLSVICALSLAMTVRRDKPARTAWLGALTSRTQRQKNRRVWTALAAIWAGLGALFVWRLVRDLGADIPQWIVLLLAGTWLSILVGGLLGLPSSTLRPDADPATPRDRQTAGFSKP